MIDKSDSDSNNNKYIIGTRASRLALKQVDEFLSLMEQNNISRDRFEVKTLMTKGDQIHHKPLREVSEEGKNAFTSEIQNALRDKQIDIAIHSTKDIAGNIKIDDLILASFPKRLSPFDCIISRVEIEDFQKLPSNFVVGTVSARRKASLHRLSKNIVVKNLRGNVQTRIEKLKGIFKWKGHKSINYDAIIMAEAAIERSDKALDLTGLFVRSLKPDEMLPAAGQGSICVECRKEDNQLIDLVRKVNDSKTEQEVRLEREILYLLGGNCHTVISVYVSTDKETNKISVKLEISEENGDNLFRVSDNYSLDEYKEIAEKISKKMIKKILDKENQIYLNHRLNLYPRT